MYPLSSCLTLGSKSFIFICMLNLGYSIFPNGSARYEIHPPPPQLWVCRDTYFIASVDDGLRYVSSGSPPGSQDN